jgi:hypothetical protein
MTQIARALGSLRTHPHRLVAEQMTTHIATDRAAIAASATAKTVYGP